MSHLGAVILNGASKFYFNTVMREEDQQIRLIDEFMKKIHELILFRNVRGSTWYRRFIKACNSYIKFREEMSEDSDSSISSIEQDGPGGGGLTRCSICKQSKPIVPRYFPSLQTFDDYLPCCWNCYMRCHVSVYTYFHNLGGYDVNHLAIPLYHWIQDKLGS